MRIIFDKKEGEIDLNSVEILDDDELSFSEYL